MHALKEPMSKGEGNDRFFMLVYLSQRALYIATLLYLEF